MSQVTIEVLFPLAVDQAFSYRAPTGLDLKVGDLVIAPFRNKATAGVVWALSETPFNGPLKEINERCDLPSIPAGMLEFIRRVADYTLTPLGNALHLCLSKSLVEVKATRKRLDVDRDYSLCATVNLSPEQQHAATAITEALTQGGFHSFFLDGVTGSGKTEVYFAAIETCLKQGRQALVMLPEIALTSQLLQRFTKRFGAPPLVWHSTLSPSQRRQTWQAVLAGAGQVVIGARSGLFLPFPKLGLIIVDEEHDGSYKQEEQVLYNARDMAVLRAHLEKCPVVLVSATPSIETMYNVSQGRYQRLPLANRHGVASLPEIYTVDMRQQPKGWISLPVQDAIRQGLDRGEQSLLYLNRRGYAPITLCHGCGYRITCDYCSSAMVNHRQKSSVLRCHHCGFHKPLPETCPECLVEKSFIPCGPGVERIDELAAKIFPQARRLVLTSDMVSTPQKLQELLDQIQDHQVDLIIGTQILAKGHHFPLITTVGVIDADLGLSGGDLRCAEKTYQLLHQVAGRAGRENLPGRVFLQTFNPDHGVIQALRQQDRDRFLDLEMQARQSQEMPPYGRLLAITLAGRDEQLVITTARALVKKAPSHDEVMIFGPAPAPLSVLRGKHRWRLLIKTSKRFPIQQYVKHWLKQLKVPSSVQLIVDVDPQSFW